MNLADYPTPKTEALWIRLVRNPGPGSSIALRNHSNQLEREAAAWKAVAEKLVTELRDLAWLSGPAGCPQPNDAELALAAFDALKSQLEKP
jgi:hypothetical protein